MTYVPQKPTRKKAGKIFIKTFPKKTEKQAVRNEIKNNIKFAPKEIFVFFIPYVIPIPKESILLTIDKIIEFNIIITPLTT